MKNLIPRPAITEEEAHDLTCAILNQIQADISEIKHARQEVLTTFGFSPAKPATVEMWRDLSEKVEAGVITEKDRLREMTQYLWHEADKERRQALARKRKPPKR